MSGVLVVGDIINDLVVRPEGPAVPDSDTPAAIAWVPGGSGANQAAWMAALGVPTRLAGRVGAPDAHQHRSALMASGVDARLGEDAFLATGSIVILVGPDGSRTMFTDRGANRALAGADLGPELLEDMSHLHVSGHSLIEAGTRAAVVGLWSSAGEAGLTRSADPGSASFLAQMGPAPFLAAVRGADVLFPNLAEARLLAGTDEADGAARWLAGLFPLIALKRGDDGVLMATSADGLRPVPARPVTVVDPTGAGDAFAAGFLHAWLGGADPVASATAGVDAAALAVQQVGGRPDSGVVTIPADPPWSQLRALARAASERAHAPWSGLAVGAAGLTDDGRMLTAANVENASYGVTLCAECGLVSALRAAGASALTAVAVVAGDGRPLAPCGRCRQVLLDNGGPGLLIDAGPGRPPVRLDTLLPDAFDATTLIERRDR
jgi:homotetrameric cytidine deaminase